MKEVKVRILSTCQDCDGQAYLPSSIGVDSRGVEYQRFLPCPTCNGCGQTGKWVTLPEFQKLLKEAECPHEHIFQIGGFHFSEGCVDDNIQDVCRDCGQVLD